MYHWRFFLLLFLANYFVMSQEPVEKPSLNPTTNSRWEYDGFSYADFGTGEEHSYFSVTYQLNPKLYAELQGFYDSYRANDVLFLPLLLKWYPTKKVYLFAGGGIELRRSKMNEGSLKTTFRMLNGVGYEPQKNISIEAVHDLNFGKNWSGINATPSNFTLKGKYRF